MSRLPRTIVSATLGAVMLTAAGGAASAHMTGGVGGHFGGGHFRHHFYDYGYIGLYDDGYYDSGCGYLRYKAHETGRPYWWRRYHACLDVASAIAGFGASAANAAVARTPQSIECSKAADAKGLHGKDRETLRSECKRGGKTSEALPTPKPAPAVATH